QKVIKNVDFNVNDDEEFTTFAYDKGTIFVTPNRIEYFEKGKPKRVYKIKLKEEDKMTYDEKNKNLILIREKAIAVLNPDKGLGIDETKRIKFRKPKTITTIETRDNGYFINGNWEYA
ncbi:hypothetical protein C1E23_21090, partial [Pseudoalteromonas phenolica]